MNWIYKDESFTEIPFEKYGFIYRIEYSDGTRYIGKKSFFNLVTLPPLKNTKTKRHVIKESNWKKYSGSCKKAKDKTIVKKEILELCNSKRHLTYAEESWLFLCDVLYFDSYLNSNIGGRHFDNFNKTEGEYLKYFRGDKKC